ncbi:hypothetical protein [Streptomyces sp. NPDC051561]
MFPGRESDVLDRARIEPGYADGAEQAPTPVAAPNSPSGAPTAVS